jgi:hypothetical protein
MAERPSMADPERPLDPSPAVPAAPAGASRYCLGSRQRDLLAVVLLTLLVLAGSPFLRVYHRVTLIDLSVVRIEPDGRRTALPTPPSLRRGPGRPWAEQRGTAAAIGALEARIQRLMRADPAIATAPPGTRFEWTIRYSKNSTRLDRTAVYLYSVPADVTR